jgi:hypothetical protein
MKVIKASSLEEINTEGADYVGRITIDYGRLVKAFGLPTCGPNDPNPNGITCNWILRFEDSKIAIIYHWGEKTPFQETEWFIGGFDPNVVGLVFETIIKLEQN